MQTKQVIDYLDLTFRPELQEGYDNSGFLLGDPSAPYRGALVALDLTPAVAAEAVELGLNLIVTHHPFIFTGLKRITADTHDGRLVMELVRHGVGVYAAHTNLDNLVWGVNGELARRLGLGQCRILKPLATAPEAGAGMVGELAEECEADDFLRRVRAELGLPVVRCSAHEATRRTRRVALCGGAGAFLIPDALAAGADLFLTADLKYHDFQRTTDRMILADIGHYESEQFAKEIFFRTISEKFSNFVCRISERQTSIVRYI